MEKHRKTQTWRKCYTSLLLRRMNWSSCVWHWNQQIPELGWAKGFGTGLGWVQGCSTRCRAGLHNTGRFEQHGAGLHNTSRAAQRGAGLHNMVQGRVFVTCFHTTPQNSTSRTTPRQLNFKILYKLFYSAFVPQLYSPSENYPNQIISIICDIICHEWLTWSGCTVFWVVMGVLKYCTAVCND